VADPEISKGESEENMCQAVMSSCIANAHNGLRVFYMEKASYLKRSGQ